MLQTLDISNYEFVRSNNLSLKGLQHRVLKILRFKYLTLFQRLNSFSLKTPAESQNILHHE